MSGNDIARQVLSDELAFLWPIGYLAYRLLLLPRMAQSTDDKPISIMDETEPDVPDAQRGGRWVFLGLSVMFLAGFGAIAAQGILTVAEQHPVWGALAVLLAAGMVTMIAALEWVHLQNGRYTDLLSDADEGKSKSRAARYARVGALLQGGGILWLGAFVVASLWLWEISRNG